LSGNTNSIFDFKFSSVGRSISNFDLSSSLFLHIGNVEELELDFDELELEDSLELELLDFEELELLDFEELYELELFEELDEDVDCNARVW